MHDTTVKKKQKEKTKQKKKPRGHVARGAAMVPVARLVRSSISSEDKQCQSPSARVETAGSERADCKVGIDPRFPLDLWFFTLPIYHPVGAALLCS